MTEEENKDANVVITGAETTEEIQTTEQQNPPTAETENKPVFTDADFIAYAKSKGKEVNSFDEVFAERVVEKEVIKEVNPYEGVDFDDDDLNYIKYKKKTGRSRKDYDSLNKNFDEVSAIDLARERIRKDLGKDMSNDKLDAYIEKKLGIADLEDLEETDEMELEMFTKEFREQKKLEQEKYKQPVEKKTPDVVVDENIVELSDGSRMPKDAYDNLVENHNKHIEEAKKSVDSVTDMAFKIVVDNPDGTKRELDYSFEPSVEDKQRLLSLVTDVNGTMETRYRSKENVFNHNDFSNDMLWTDKKFREKAIVTLIEKARAEAIEEQIRIGNNENFTPRGALQQQQQKTTGRIVPVKDLLNL